MFCLVTNLPKLYILNDTFCLSVQCGDGQGRCEERNRRLLVGSRYGFVCYDTTEGRPNRNRGGIRPEGSVSRLGCTAIGLADPNASTVSMDRSGGVQMGVRYPTGSVEFSRTSSCLFS